MSKAQEVLVKYLSIKEVSEKWGISTRRIQILCKEDRICGAPIRQYKQKR